MKKKITNKDLSDWENFLNSKDRIYVKDNFLSRNNTKTMKTLDLHGYSLRDANIAVKSLIIDSYNKNIRKLKIITGKGLRSKNETNPYKSKKFGILKYSVPEYINGDKELSDKIYKINDKEINELNSGHFTIYLKKNENKY